MPRKTTNKGPWVVIESLGNICKQISTVVLEKLTHQTFRNEYVMSVHDIARFCWGVFGAFFEF